MYPYHLHATRVNIIGSLQNENQIKALCLGYKKVPNDIVPKFAEKVMAKKKFFFFILIFIQWQKYLFLPILYFGLFLYISASIDMQHDMITPFKKQFL